MNAPLEVRYYKTKSGKSPFEEWFDELKDGKAQLIVTARLRRLAYGLAGKCEPVGKGVFELKIYYGPGYRIYFAQEEYRIILLLLGGDKSTQERDILKSHIYWEDYLRRKP